MPPIAAWLPGRSGLRGLFCPLGDAPDSLEAFRHFHETMNTAIHEAGNTSVNRFFARDARGYEDGAVALVVGGSIVIPPAARRGSPGRAAGGVARPLRFP